MTHYPSAGPLWHKSDPETSKEAAAKHREQAQTNLKLVVEKVRAYPGRTSGELAGLLGMDLAEVRRRLSDAKAATLVTNGSARPCRVLGNRASVWEVLK